MQKTQFLPVPAGISVEQFRVWEAFEAGDLLREDLATIEAELERMFLWAGIVPGQ